MDWLLVLLAQTGPTDTLASTRLILAVLCVVVASVVALAVAVGLSRRISLLAGQPRASNGEINAPTTTVASEPDEITDQL